MSLDRITLTDRVAVLAKPAVKEYTLQDTALKGFALRVRSSGAKSWVLRLAIHGKVQRLTLGNAKRVRVDDARAKAHALLAQVPKVVMVTDLVRPDAPTLAAFARTYQERRSKQWRPSTKRAYGIYFRCTLLPFFGDMPLDWITRADVARWFHDYSKLRPGGANQALSILRTLFNCARSWGVLAEQAINPCKGIKKNRSAPRGRILNRDELQRLGAALDRQVLVRPDQVDAVRLLLLTGCRHGEILGLRWREVRPGRLDLADSKTGPRRVLLGQSAAAVLARRRQRQQLLSAYVFPRPRDPSQSRASIRSFWSMIRRQAGLPATLRLHDLRHTYASYPLMGGETLIMTGKLLGHRHARSTQRYAHLSGEFLLAAADRVAASILERGRSEGGPRSL